MVKPKLNLTWNNISIGLFTSAFSNELSKSKHHLFFNKSCNCQNMRDKNVGGGPGFNVGLIRFV